jgi:hypothetical protein
MKELAWNISRRQQNLSVLCHLFHLGVPCKSIHPPWRFSYFVALQPNLN